MYLYSCIKSLITFSFQLLLLLTGICFPNKILVSGIRSSCSSETTQILYSKSLPCHCLLITPSITVSLLHRSCSDYSLQLRISTICMSYSFLLLSVTLFSSRNRYSLLLLLYYSLLYHSYKPVISATFFRCWCQVTLSHNPIS